MSSPSALTAEATATYRQHVEAAASALQDRADVPSLALVTESAAPIRERLDTETSLPCTDLPHYPTGQQGRAAGTLIVGTLADRRIVVLSPSLALHDGYTAREGAFPVRVLAEAGVETLLLAGTATALRPELRPGDLMLVADHINLQGANPLVGPNVDDWGPRFPDMTEPYAPALRRTAETVARDKGVPLRKGVYLATLGPDSGTRAEARMWRTMGADAVGSGLVPEVIAARHMRVRVAAFLTIEAQALPGGKRRTDDQDEETAAPPTRQVDLLQAFVSGIGTEGT